jgi:hypothetical protein
MTLCNVIWTLVSLVRGCSRAMIIVGKIWGLPIWDVAGQGFRWWGSLELGLVGLGILLKLLVSLCIFTFSSLFIMSGAASIVGLLLGIFSSFSPLFWVCVLPGSPELRYHVATSHHSPSLFWALLFCLLGSRSATCAARRLGLVCSEQSQGSLFVCKCNFSAILLTFMFTSAFGIREPPYNNRQSKIGQTRIHPSGKSAGAARYLKK